MSEIDDVRRAFVQLWGSMGPFWGIAPTTARVFHSNVASPHPNSPGWSVSTLTKTQLRISALTTVVVIRVILIA